jgi:hypothetical protein
MVSDCLVSTTKTYGIDMWRLIAKALGEKSGASNSEADKVACIRLGIVLSYIITNCFIIAGVIRHWND